MDLSAPNACVNEVMIPKLLNHSDSLKLKTTFYARNNVRNKCFPSLFEGSVLKKPNSGRIIAKKRVHDFELTSAKKQIVPSKSELYDHVITSTISNAQKYPIDLSKSKSQKSTLKTLQNEVVKELITKSILEADGSLNTETNVLPKPIKTDTLMQSKDILQKKVTSPETPVQVSCFTELPSIMGKITFNKDNTLQDHQTSFASKNSQSVLLGQDSQSNVEILNEKTRKKIAKYSDQRYFVRKNNSEEIFLPPFVSSAFNSSTLCQTTDSNGSLPKRHAKIPSFRQTNRSVESNSSLGKIDMSSKIYLNSDKNSPEQPAMAFLSHSGNQDSRLPYLASPDHAWPVDGPLLSKTKNTAGDSIQSAKTSHSTPLQSSEERASPSDKSNVYFQEASIFNNLSQSYFSNLNDNPVNIQSNADELSEAESRMIKLYLQRVLNELSLTKEQLKKARECNEQLMSYLKRLTISGTQALSENRFLRQLLNIASHPSISTQLLPTLSHEQHQ